MSKHTKYPNEEISSHSVFDCFCLGKYKKVASCPSYCLNINSDIEEIWASLHLSNVSPIILGSFYRPPHSPDSIPGELSVSMSHIRSQFPSSKIVLGGDFNCPGIDWLGHILLDSYVPISLRERLIRFLDDFHSTPIVTFPTRGPNTLDLCFVSHPDLVLNCDSPPGLSDHEAELSTTISRGKQAPHKIYLYNQANWTAICDCVSSFSEEYFSLNQVGLLKKIGVLFMIIYCKQSADMCLARSLVSYSTFPGRQPL